MVRVMGKTRPFLKYSLFGFIRMENTTSCCVSQQILLRLSVYLQYIQDVSLQQQGKNSTGKSDTRPTGNSPKRLITNQLTRVGLFLLPSTVKHEPQGAQEIFPGHQFPPYGAPYTANKKVRKPTVLVRKKKTSK
ncbi:hypothetical protein TNCV_638421 [Trichonephila clavipes]|nr:hypothetical protein TNCV_638421 [Trichonephila clavipes]